LDETTYLCSIICHRKKSHVGLACTYPDVVMLFYLPRVNKVKGSELLPLQQRLTAPPPRQEDIGISSKIISEDNMIIND
jgi:hypothetical protein